MTGLPPDPKVTTLPPGMKNTQAVVDKFAEIPSEKWPIKFLRTMVGGAIVWFAWIAKEHWPTLPDRYTYIVGVSGGVVMAGELLAMPFRFALGAARDVLALVKSWRSPNA